MRVMLETEGGFVYLPDLHPPVNVDTEELTAEEAGELQRLLEAADFFDLPPVYASPPAGADYLRYKISVTSPDRNHTVHLTDPIEDPHLQALVEWLEDRADGPGSRP